MDNGKAVEPALLVDVIKVIENYSKIIRLVELSILNVS